MRVLRNLSRETVVTNFKGRTVVIAAKATFSTKDDEQANYLLETYGFLRDETKTVVHPITKVRKTFGKKVGK